MPRLGEGNLAFREKIEIVLADVHGMGGSPSPIATMTVAAT